MAYTVKQLAKLAGVSTRTLHYYDEIGLLPPSSYGENGYRYYEEDAVLRLQQILFFRELDFSLTELRAIVDKPDFDVLRALQTHKRALQQRIRRLNNLVQTIDRTTMHLKGARKVEASELFTGFDEAQQERYEQEAMQKHGETRVKESRRRLDSYSREQKARIGDEGEAIYRDLLDRVDEDPASPEVQQIIARWHQHIRYFFEPSREMLRGLGQTYADHPAFTAVYRRMHLEMPEFLRNAIAQYCASLPENA